MSEFFDMSLLPAALRGSFTDVVTSFKETFGDDLLGTFQSVIDGEINEDSE